MKCHFFLSFCYVTLVVICYVKHVQCKCSGRRLYCALVCIRPFMCVVIVQSCPVIALSYMTEGRQKTKQLHVPSDFMPAARPRAGQPTSFA